MMIGMGEPQQSMAMEVPTSSSETIDPLVLFGESLTSKGSTRSSGTGITAIPPPISSSSSSSSSWPHNAAHPLPTFTNAPIPTTSTEDAKSRGSLEPPTSLEQALQQSKTKKQINPTTHG
jgi:hypothetical protein